MQSYFYRDQEGREIGPLDLATLAKFRSAGVVGADTPIRATESTDWKPCREIIADTPVAPSATPQPTAVPAGRRSIWPVITLVAIVGFLIYAKQKDDSRQSRPGIFGMKSRITSSPIAPSAPTPSDTSPSTPQEVQNPAPSSFVGEWTNKDFNTRGITRVHIRVEGNTIIVHMWGRCHPKECDWGDSVASVSGQTLSLTWDQRYCVRNQQMKLLTDGSLQLIGHTHFTDKSGRNDYDGKEFFAVGLVHDFSD